MSLAFGRLGTHFENVFQTEDCYFGIWINESSVNLSDTESDGPDWDRIQRVNHFMLYTMTSQHRIQSFKSIVCSSNKGDCKSECHPSIELFDQGSRLCCGV